MKKLFKNYTYKFDKNEKKLIQNFCNKAITQMSSDEKFRKDINAFSSIIAKLNSDTEEIKFTKDEKNRLVLQLKENIKYIDKRKQNRFFIMRWFLNMMYNQYNNLLTKHFVE